MDEDRMGRQVCVGCQTALDLLLKEIFRLRTERKRFEDLYKTKCRQELRSRAELLHVRDLFEKQLYQLRKNDDLGLLQYLSCRIALQDKIIRENSRELVELRNGRVSTGVFEEQCGCTPDPCGIPSEHLRDGHIRHEPPLNADHANKDDLPKIRLANLEVIRGEQQVIKFQNRYSQQADKPRLTTLRRNASLRDADVIAANQHALLKSSKEKASRTHNTVLFARPCEKRYVASLQSALQTATQEKALLERRVAIRMDSTDINSGSAQRRLSKSSTDEQSTLISRQLGTADSMLLDALKDTNEALKSELLRLTPFEMQTKDLNNQVSHLREVESLLQSKVNDLQVENDRLVKQLEASQKQACQQELIVHQMRNDYEKSIAASKQRLRLLLKERDALHALQEQSNDNIARLKQINWSLEQENLASNKVRNELKVSNDSCLTEVKRLKLVNQQLQSQIGDLKSVGAPSVAPQCPDCGEKDILIGKQNRQIELLRKLVHNSTKTTVTTQTSTTASLTGASDGDDKPKAVPEHQARVRHESDPSIGGTSLSEYGSQDRPAETAKKQAKPRNNVPQKEAGAVQSSLSVSDLSKEFCALRECIQASEERRKELERDYERKLLRLSIRNEELDRLRRV